MPNIYLINPGNRFFGWCESNFWYQTSNLRNAHSKENFHQLCDFSSILTTSRQNGWSQSENLTKVMIIQMKMFLQQRHFVRLTEFPFFSLFFHSILPLSLTSPPDIANISFSSPTSNYFHLSLSRFFNCKSYDVSSNLKKEDKITQSYWTSLKWGVK